MENNQKGQNSNDQQQQQTTGEQNPTLNEKGTSVADYGNVMGGSSDENAQYGQTTGTGRQDGNETMGNP
jgi:hypothetical protein